MNQKRFMPVKTGILMAVLYCLGIFIAVPGIGCNNPVGPGNTSPPANRYQSEIPLAWFELQLRLVKDTSGFSPPVASRAFGYSGVTLYEAVTPGIPARRSLAGQLNGLPELPQSDARKEYHWPTAANAALASITRRLFANATPENKSAIDHLEMQFEKQFKSNLNREVVDRSIAYGKSIADAVYIWSLTDGGHEGYLKNFPDTYTPPSGYGFWTPTPPDYSRALQPYWGNNRPFVLTSGGECNQGPPPAYSEDPGSPFYTDAMEVYNMVNHITPEQRAIAEFWSDDAGQTSTPPGHSLSILNQIIEQTNPDLDLAAEAYAKVGMAVADAFICCWHTKYQYCYLRPVSCIQAMIDPDWLPILVTPPFPEYTSGHSSQGGATAYVLTDMFGDMAFTDHTHDSRGMAPRSFTSFSAAAEEAAISRLYGGIHFRSAIENGMVQGKLIGQKVCGLRFRK